MPVDPLAHVYTRTSNKGLHMTRVRFKVGTHPSSSWLVRQRDLEHLKPGGRLRIFESRNAEGVSILVDEFRADLWFVQRF